MSDGSPTSCHRITKPRFRACPTRRCRSQAPLCLCALWMVPGHPEGTFGRLRYPFGGDRPSQTPRQAVSRAQFHGRRLGSQCCRGGIPTSAPWRLASPLHSLPPILYVQHRIPASSWSEAPWGLSVLAQVASIFTGTSISPGASPRQRPNHYAFRAGRNLPDKEFRYLRTVIVTAAVYWGLGSMLRWARGPLTSPLDLPAPGRRQPVYLALRLRTGLCFC